MPHTNARRNNARRPSRLLPFFGLGLIAVTAGFFSFVQPAARAASAFTVNSTGDGADSNTADNLCNDGAGNCSLRAAIQQANATPGTDTINFQIGTGVQTIVLGAALPDVSDPVNIDGTTQPGYGGTPLVEIRGKDDGFTRIAWALHITAGGSTVRALAVGRFDVAGILLGTEGANDAGGNKVESCYGGLRADGVTMAALAIHGTCVKIADSPNNTIGGTSAAARNVLSGCGFGVHISGTKSTGNIVQGNYIGPNAAGTDAVRNSNGSQSIGVNIGNASNNVIGGDTAPARNVISGNSSTGVLIAGSAAANVVKGNYIGTNAAGTAALPNGRGIEILSADNVVGGLAPSPGVAPGNLISGQTTNLQVNGSRVIVQGNLIGTDVTGSSGFLDNPFGFAFGIVCFSPDVVIGGTQTGARNVISAVSTGIFIDGFGTAVIQGNYIGTDLGGTAARGNALGIDVGGRGSQIGGTASGAGNLISGNRRGVLLRSGASTVQGNLIGTDASGISPLPNVGTGIFIDGAPTSNGNASGASNSVVGGTAAGAGNRIAFNGRSGIAIGPHDTRGFFSTGNRLRGNSIYSNGLLGIDLVSSTAPDSLDADGPSPDDPGDADTGPNRMQNAPTVNTVEVAGGITSVSGRLDSAPNRTYAIDLYANAACDPSGHGEGQTYLGSTQATTDASGVATFSGSFPAPPSSSQVITATSTDGAGNTSEFSACHGAGAADTVQFTSSSYTTDEAMAARVVVSRTLGTAGAASVAYATSDLTAQAGVDYAPASGTLHFAPGETTKTVDITIIDDTLRENKESFRLTLSNPTGGIALGTKSTSEVQIDDNDPFPLVSVTDSTVVEGDSGTTAAVFTVTLSTASGQTVTVGYRTFGGTEGSDYTVTSGTLTFAPGETSKTVNVSIIGDTMPEPNESFDFLLQSLSNAFFIDSVGAGTILNDDAALSINDLSVGEGDSGQTAFNFTVGIPFPTVNPVSVNYATADGTAAAGSDYVAASGTLNFAPGETTKTVMVDVNGDTANEANETFFVNLSGATNATVADAQGQGTINNEDEDNMPALRFSQATYPVGESAHFVTITVTRTGDASLAVGVGFNTSDGTARERRDYTAVSGTLQFAAGETSKTFDVLLTEDSYQEPEETINLTLSNPTGGAIMGSQSTSVVSIAADDSTQPQPNPIDDTTNFVRQHYHDFLNREPDAAGLQFWTNEIEGCDTNVQCRQVKRINVSAAFFLSIEFQETGFLAYKARKAAFGNLSGKPVPIVRDEMTFDAGQIGDGVAVGVGDWFAKLEQNKAAYFNALVASERFAALYPASMSPEAFVNALNANAGGALSTAERQSLINELEGGTKTRAQALRAVAEDSDLHRAETNKAFVLMQYFGYLRRDPDAVGFDGQPDPNFLGYNFWLGKLSDFNGNFVQAEMVRAFIESIEYRQRFGQ
jgi:CSLREA domain-containing protein